MSGGLSRPTSGVTPDEQVPVRDREALRVHQAAADVPVVTGEPRPGGRRDRRQQETAQMAVVAASRPRTDVPADIPVPESETDAADPTAPGTDPAVPARQKVLTGRAGALNERARRIQELSDRLQQRSPVQDDPTSAHNISMLLAPRVVRSPGGAAAVLRVPATSRVPVVVPRTGQPGGIRAREVQSGPTVPDAVHPEPTPAAGPVEARSAFGLEPLDARTAGVGRIGRLRLLQYSLIGVGAAALVTGIMVTVSSFNG